MIEIELTDDRAAVRAGPLVLSFAWTVDRWAHGLEVDGQLVVETVEWDEGAGDPTRVVSPAFQQYSQQKGLDGHESLLVGQWGRHHFSGVYRFTELPGGVVVSAEVAVRSQAPLSAFASTYRCLLDSGSLVDAGPSVARWSVGRGGLEMRATPAGPLATRIAVAEMGRREARIQVDAPIVDGPSTRLLNYQWVWSDNSRAGKD